MPVKSLVEQARNCCIRNITAIVDIGDAPYELVRPILLKVPNAEQLNQLETNCPQLIGYTAEIWRAIIKREIEAYAHEDPPEPPNPESWYKLYRKLRRVEQKEIEKQEELLVGQLQGLKDSAAERTSKVVDPRSLPRLRRALGGRVEKRPATTAPRGSDPSKLRFTSGSRTKAVSGQDVLNKARREAREMSYFSMRSNSGLAKPSHQGPSRANAPITAPKSFVSEHQRSRTYRDGEIPVGSVVVPRWHNSAGKSVHKGVTSPHPASSKVETKAKGPEKRGTISPENVRVSASAQHLQPPSTEKDRPSASSDGDRKMTKVPRVASRSPVGREGPPNRPQGSPSRPKSEVDIFMPVKRKRRV